MTEAQKYHGKYAPVPKIKSPNLQANLEKCKVAVPHISESMEEKGKKRKREPSHNDEPSKKCKTNKPNESTQDEKFSALQSYQYSFDTTAKILKIVNDANDKKNRKIGPKKTTLEFSSWRVNPKPPRFCGQTRQNMFIHQTKKWVYFDQEKTKK